MWIMRICVGCALLAGSLWCAERAAAWSPPRAEVSAGDFENEHPTDGDDGEHAAGGSSNPLSIDPDLAFVTLIVFGVLLAVLGKFAWKPIVAALDEREKNIARNIEEAARQNEDARELLAEYDRRLAAAQDQVRAILDEARRDAEKSQQDILAKGRAEAEAEKNRAKREIEIATSVALKELAVRSTDLAIELAGKIVRKELNAKDHSQLIQEAVGRFPDAGPSRN